MQILDAYLSHNVKQSDVALVLNGDMRACEMFCKWQSLKKNCKFIVAEFIDKDMNLISGRMSVSRSSFRRSQSSFISNVNDSIEKGQFKKVNSTMIICKEEPREEDEEDKEPLINLQREGLTSH